MITIEEKNRQRLRVNMLVIASLCLTLGAVSYSAYSYWNLQASERKLQASEQELKIKNDSLKTVNKILGENRTALLEYQKQLDSLNNAIQQIMDSGRFVPSSLTSFPSGNVTPRTLKGGHLVNLTTRGVNVSDLEGLIGAINTIDAGKKKARELEQRGFEQLCERKFTEAMQSFDSSEKASPGFNASFDIWLLLYQSRSRLTDPNVQNQLIDTIQKKYGWYDKSSCGSPQVNHPIPTR
jgi:hypothetical protein